MTPTQKLLGSEAKKKKKKICFVITSEIHYARGKMILEELKRRKDVELQIVVGASAILTNYGDVLSLLKKDRFQCAAKITMTVEGGNPIAMAKTTGLGVSEFASVFDNLGPDIVVIRGDRYEVLSAAIAAAYLNIPVAHIEGGDATGTIDESVRHAVTKLAHLHFVTNEIAKTRVLRMGENPRFVFDVGAPEVEFVSCHSFKTHSALINYIGVGDVIDIEKQYIIVMHHPVATEYGHNREHTELLLREIYGLKIPTIWFWPNVDAGTDEISRAMRVFREKYAPKNIRFMKYLPPDEFYGVLMGARCLIGNSSSGIKECSYLGIPVVNIGTRQNGRARGKNVIDVGYRSGDIVRAVKTQLTHGVFAHDLLYYKKGTSKKIADILVMCQPQVQKQFFD